MVEFKIYEDKGRKAFYTTSKRVALSVGENTIVSKLQIDKVKMWD